jgi:hypothetical protein
MPLTELNARKFEELVADALEHLWDYAYLGTHPLVELQSVKRQMPPNGKWSHVDMGRLLNGILQNAIEKIKPNNLDSDLSREKHYFLILRKAYVEGVHNKAIAVDLSIGERTLYRYSAKAIQVVAQILRDWEQ